MVQNLKNKTSKHHYQKHEEKDNENSTMGTDLGFFPVGADCMMVHLHPQLDMDFL